VDSVDFGTMLQASIRGLLTSLDPHSRYVTRREYLLRSQWERGELASPGLRLENSDRAITVLSVAGPAARAGIQPGDRLVRLNDTALAGLNAEAAEIQLLGEIGSKVHITLERGSPLRSDTLSLTLKRTRIDPVVTSEPRMIAPKVGYVRLAEFTPPSPKELEKRIEKVRDMGAKQLILDLRGNPGGDIQAMVEIASLFLRRQTEVFHTEGRRKNLSQAVGTEEDGEFAKLPLVVLIDAGSASAAEVLAGSLQDHDRALIVGRRSFGKALIQSSLPLPNADVVMLTTARVATPSGRIIQRRYRGIGAEDYLDQAGRPGSEADTSQIYRTSRGRAVRGGGGILPDIVLPDQPALPSWFTVAVDSGYDAVCDSVAKTLSLDGSAKAVWATDTASWNSRLVAPFLTRVSSGLGITVAPDSPLRALLGLRLAERTAFLRWGAEGAEEFSIRHDPDVDAALTYLPRYAELLRHPATER
jgi:carboxyl-terminal processing protease